MGPSGPSGIKKHVGNTLTWADLNPSEGVFDFSKVDSTLAAAEAGDYGVVFRLKASVYDGAEGGWDNQPVFQTIPQWVVSKYNLTNGFTFRTRSDRRYAAPWHSGVQAEFHKLQQEFGRRRLLESPHFLAIYLHGVSREAGEEMYMRELAYIDEARDTAENAGYDGTVYGDALIDAIMDCWTTRMWRWAEVAGPYAFKVAWVGADHWGENGTTLEFKYPRAQLDNYALLLGLGGRTGGPEVYYGRGVHPPLAGQFYDGAHVTSDWAHRLRDGRYWGAEIEVSSVYKDPFDDSQVIGPGEPRDLAFRSAFFRAAQLGMNLAWTHDSFIDRAGNNNGDYADDALPTWFTLVAGKPAAESPDAVTWLREAQVRYMPAPPYTDQEVQQSDPPQSFKNFERLLMQRDVAGAVTRPAHFLYMPHVWMKPKDSNHPEVFAEYTARATDVASGQRNIAFLLDPVFRASLGSTSVEIKVTYLDEIGTTWNVQVAKGGDPPVNLGSVTNGTSNAWKTATFTLTAANAPFEPGDSGSPLGEGIDFVINVPSGGNDVTVRYVRVVRTAEVAVAPRIKVHPISQPIPCDGFATLHVVAEGPAPYTYQWRKDGVSISGATQSSLVRYPGDAGSYSVVVGNAFGSVTSGSAVLTESNAPAVPVALEADPSPLSSDGNRVLEPGEHVEVVPYWRNDCALPVTVDGFASDFGGPAGAAYTLVTADASYGTIEPGASGSCQDAGSCYEVQVSYPSSRPSTHWDASFDETLSEATVPIQTWTLHIGRSFTDVASTSPFYRAVEAMLHHGVPAGCGLLTWPDGAHYCPGNFINRARMAIVLLKAKEGASYLPPPCVSGDELYDDVPASHSLCRWIEELTNREVVGGCGGNNYCPLDSVTREQMAVFLLKTLQGGSYVPPACIGVFADVPCPSTFANWVEDVYARGIAGGCSDAPLMYCPTAAVNWGQTAVFVSNAFGLTLYGP